MKTKTSANSNQGGQEVTLTITFNLSRQAVSADRYVDFEDRISKKITFHSISITAWVKNATHFRIVLVYYYSGTQKAMSSQTALLLFTQRQ